MSKTSEDIHIKSHGKKCVSVAKIIITIVCIALYPIKWPWSQNYYINTYENPRGPNPEQLSADIFIKSIDLTSRSVNDSLRLNGKGIILFKKPASYLMNNRQYLVTINENEGKVFYTILRAENSNLDVLRADSIDNASVEIFRQYQGEQGFRFGLSASGGGGPIFRSGLYGIGQNFGFRFLGNVNTGDEPGLIRNIQPYDYLIKVPFDSTYNLYYTSYNSQRWLIKLNPNLTEAVDSLLLQPGDGDVVFAYSSDMNKFYCLHVNYELHYNQDQDLAYKSRQDRYVNPDVWIIDPVTLDIENQIAIDDYPEGNYPGEDGGLADVVGDYIVYYFFRGVGRDRFDPAMLFIFDTRTNEATWLRVGWR